ncbi:TPA: oligogalacturonate-specific porin KdgM family protein [Klebsiella pneumoniae]|uniref:oligogalacturonate-specific porin KdgM family protein n=1 Tax=Klebsiella pneumoniae TaxID=573 RepID=UPI001E3676CE|nr:oligogalacturonate-specific porin KdgM family protein [Klebsiella pneumoniae]
MKRIIPVASIVLTGLAAHSVYAEQPHGFIDYRHEYLDKKRTHADRVEFGTFFSNGIGLMGELRYNTQEGNKDKWDPSQFNNNGSGLSIVYRFKPLGNDFNLLIVFYVQIMPDDLVMQLHRF